MNEEQSRRLADAADSLLQATDSLEDARDVVNDKRFDSESDRDRSAAAIQMANRLDSAGKRIEEALRKATVAAATLAREGAYGRYMEGIHAAREGRALAKRSSEQDGSSNKRAVGQEALGKLEAALQVAAHLTFPTN